MLLTCHLTGLYKLTGIAAYIDSTINRNNNNNNNYYYYYYNYTMKPDYNGTKRDRIFSVVGMFSVIQVLGIKLKISEL
jgi:hypothetical protein